jgi:hypothetical protein
MRRALSTVLSLLAFLLESPIAHAETDCPLPRAGEQVLPGKLMPQGALAWKTRRLPARHDVTAALNRLDYGDELPAVHEMDLSNDGREELFIVSPARLCGTGGCAYVLLAGGSLAMIGEFFGHLAFLDERVNEFRVIQSYSHVGAGLTNLDTYVFDGKTYRLAAHVVLDSCGFEQWQRAMRK